jgi:hypothetical protein
VTEEFAKLDRMIYVLIIVAEPIDALVMDVFPRVALVREELLELKFVIDIFIA